MIDVKNLTNEQIEENYVKLRDRMNELSFHLLDAGQGKTRFITRCD